MRKIIEKNVKNKRRKRDDRMAKLDEKNNGPTVGIKIKRRINECRKYMLRVRMIEINDGIENCRLKNRDS